jgi:RNA recognition motif-containing protein
MGKTVYVGNIGDSITADKLTELFGEHGDVQEVRVITDQYTGRPRGFAFVDMATGEGAKAAISDLNGQAVDGRELKVAEAKPRRRRDPGRDVYRSYFG